MIVSIVVVAVFLSFVVQFIRSRRKAFALRSELGISGPETNLLFGNLLDVVRYRNKYGLERTPMYRLELEKQYGTTFGWYFGGRLEISSSDLEFAREVMITQFHNFVDRETYTIADCFPMQMGLLQISGSGHNGVGWKDVRSVVSPIFTSGKIKKMHDVILERVETWITTVSEKSRNEGGYIDIYDEWQSLTLDTIARCAFGVKSDSLHDRSDVFYVNCQRFFRESALDRSWFSFMASFVFPPVGPFLRPFSAVGRAERPLIQRLRETLAERKRNFDSFEGVDLIQLLLEQDIERQKTEQKPPLGDDVIISNCHSFLLAGYETTSTALSYCTWLLAKHPEVQQRLFEEAIDTFGPEEAIDYERAMRAEYCDCVFRESLRLLPPAVHFNSRCCISDTTVQGIRIPAGTFVCVPVQGVHWKEENWPNARTFDPDRFASAENRKSPAWIPFGTGPRHCVGLRFAEMEFKTAILAAVRRFRFSLRDPDEELPVRISAVLLRPIHGVRCIVEERT